MLSAVQTVRFALTVVLKRYIAAHTKLRGILAIILALGLFKRLIFQLNSVEFYSNIIEAEASLDKHEEGPD